MTTRILFFALAPLILSACGLSHQTVDAPGGPASTRLLTLLQGEYVTVSLWDSSAYEGKVIPAGLDTLALLVDTSGARQGIPLSQVKKIRHLPGRTPYVFAGIFAGATMGAVIGYMAGKPDGSERHSGMFSFQMDFSGVAAGAGGCIGALVGGLLGGAAAPRTEYAFQANRPASAPPSDRATIMVNKLIEETASYVRFKWLNKTITLDVGPFTVRRTGDLIQISGPKTLFREAGIGID